MNPNINELVVRVRNGLLKSKRSVVVPYSSGCKNLLWKLKEDGFIRGFEIVSPQRKKRCLIILLKYSQEQFPCIAELRVTSKVERRYSFRRNQMSYHNDGFNEYYFSHDKGVNPSRNGECAFIIK
jgi:small subunit ribosomal protein S8